MMQLSHAPQGHGSRNFLGKDRSAAKTGHAPQGHGSRNYYCIVNGRYQRVMPRRGMGVEIFWKFFSESDN